MGYIYDYPEALREGTVDAWIGSGTKIAQAVSWLPTIRGLSLEQVKAVLADSRVQEAYSAEAENGGYRIMAAFPLQYRVLTANIPVRTVEDLRKLKMRCYAEQSGETAYWGALGVPTAVYDVHQLYSALQQHLVTAQANTLPVIVSTQIYNQQRYVIETKHMVYQDMLCVSSNFYRSLTPEQQGILDRAARELDDFSEEVYSAEIVRSQRILENAGLRTISADEQLISDMRRIGGPAAERELRKIYGNEKINLVMNAPVS
jgi:TRAP-type C4-dicarboxylate transport system substrate-binding protein